MLLVSETKMLDKMGVSNLLDGNTQSAISALTMATSQIETVLDTSLASGDRTDYFEYQAAFRVSPSSYTLRLTNGLLSDTPVVRMSSDGGLVNSSSPILVAGTDYIADLEQGTVTMYATLPKTPLSVMVTYSHGYASQSSSIPNWLQEAAIAYGIANASSHIAKFNRKETRDLTESHSKVARSLVARHIRSRSGSMPVMSVAE